MPATLSIMTRGRLFVIMPFGVRRLVDRAEPHDFDLLYATVLRPIAQEEGWEVVRLDELVEPGVITTHAVRELLAADLVVADVSMANGNVYYELGIRQAVSSSGTLLVALEGTSLPFDIANQRVIFYGPGSDDKRFREAYRQALRSSDAAALSSSPVRTALEAMGLTAAGPEKDAASFQREFDLRVSRARNADQLVAVWHWAKPFSPIPVSGLMDLAERLADRPGLRERSASSKHAGSPGQLRLRGPSTARLLPAQSRGLRCSRGRVPTGTGAESKRP